MYKLWRRCADGLVTVVTTLVRLVGLPRNSEIMEEESRITIEDRDEGVSSSHSNSDAIGRCGTKVKYVLNK